jgi:hypothetical protein
VRNSLFSNNYPAISNKHCISGLWFSVLVGKEGHSCSLLSSVVPSFDQSRDTTPPTKSLDCLTVLGEEHRRLSLFDLQSTGHALTSVDIPPCCLFQLLGCASLGRQHHPFSAHQTRRTEKSTGRESVQIVRPFHIPQRHPPPDDYPTDESMVAGLSLRI